MFVGTKAMLWCFLEDFNILENSPIGCLTQVININLSSVDSIPTQFLDSIVKHTMQLPLKAHV